MVNKPTHAVYLSSATKEKRYDFDNFFKAVECLKLIIETPEDFEYETVTLGSYLYKDFPEGWLTPCITYSLVKTFEQIK